MSIKQVIQSIDEQISKLQQARAFLNGTGRGAATGRGRGPRTMSAAESTMGESQSGTEEEIRIQG